METTELIDCLAISLFTLILFSFYQALKIRKLNRLKKEHEVWRYAMNEKIKELDQQVKIKDCLLEYYKKGY